MLKLRNTVRTDNRCKSRSTLNTHTHKIILTKLFVRLVVFASAARHGARTTGLHGVRGKRGGAMYFMEDNRLSHCLGFIEISLRILLIS